MFGTWVLILYCLNCSPIQIMEVRGIPSYMGSNHPWAASTCKEYGDILSGDYARRNMKTMTPQAQADAKKYWVVYTCHYEQPV